jgi:hypothetical protein
LKNFDFFEMRFRELAESTMRSYPGLEKIEIGIDGDGDGDGQFQLAYYKSIALALPNELWP